MRPNTQRLAVFLNRCLESCHSQANLTWRSAGAQDGIYPLSINMKISIALPVQSFDPLWSETLVLALCLCSKVLVCLALQRDQMSE